MLTIALPKGRIAEETLDKFEKAFGEKFIFEDRKLILEKAGFRFLNVRNQDVPTYVMHGAADLGVVGLDVLEEKLQEGANTPRVIANYTIKRVRTSLGL